MDINPYLVVIGMVLGSMIARFMIRKKRASPRMNSSIKDFRAFLVRRDRMKFSGIWFKYNAPGDGCVDDAWPKPWVWQHRWKFRWETHQDGDYLFCGFFYLGWRWLTREELDKKDQ